MNLRNIFSKLTAYMILFVIVAVLFLMFVTVPFHGPDTEADGRMSVDLSNVSYPHSYVAGSGHTNIMNETAVISPDELLDLHAQEITTEQIGYTDYTYNNEYYEIHWSDTGVLVNASGQRAFIYNYTSLVTSNGKEPTTLALDIQSRHTSPYGYAYLNVDNTRIEDRMESLIREFNYTAVDAWKNNSTTYIQYQAESTDSSFVVSDDGLIVSFDHSGDVEINYHTAVGRSAPPLFEPTWVFNESQTEEFNNPKRNDSASGSDNPFISLE